MLGNSSEAGLYKPATKKSTFTESMADKPYTVIIDGAGAVTEHRLGNHEAGEQIATSVKVVSSTVADGRRTVVLTRPLAGASPQHLTFDATAPGVPFIAAVGTGPQLAYHQSRAGGSVMLVDVGAPLCVCPVPAFGKAHGSIDGVASKGEGAQQTDLRPIISQWVVGIV